MIGFRQFFEEEEQAKHLTALQNVLGINPDDYAKTPMVGSFFGIGGPLTYNSSAYQVLGIEYDSKGVPTHAKVKMMNNMGTSPRQTYKTQGKSSVELKGSPSDDKVHLIPIKDLEGLMGQALSSAGGAAAGGMPPMPGMM
jgi:hypothetical protein